MQRVRESFRKQCLQCLGCRAVRVAKRDFVYASGQVKLVLPTPEGKECLLAIRTEGDIFGELCLTGQDQGFSSGGAEPPVASRKLPMRSGRHLGAIPLDYRNRAAWLPAPPGRTAWIGGILDGAIPPRGNLRRLHAGARRR